MKGTNTEHDEDLNRSTWTGESWLGVESMRAPKHGPARTEWTGVYAAPARKPKNRRSYR